MAENANSYQKSNHDYAKKPGMARRQQNAFFECITSLRKVFYVLCRGQSHTVYNLRSSVRGSGHI